MSKIFQIGFTSCSTRLLHQLLVNQGYRCIYSDDGKLAKRMLDNFLNMEPLLKGYEDYDCYLCMENVPMNLHVYMLLYKQLDEQYPGSKFILNTRTLEHWVDTRLKHPTYLKEYMWATSTTSVEKATNRWRAQWKSHHDEVQSYFGKRIQKDLLVYHVEYDHPYKIFFFLCNRSKVRERFIQLYQNMCPKRMSPTILDDGSEEEDDPPSESKSRVRTDVEVYCVTLPDRRDQAEETLRDFGWKKVYFFNAICKMDIAKKDYQLMSTVHFLSPNVAPCHVCRHVNAHESLLGKPTKLAVHLSYVSCLCHAYNNSHKQYVLVFEDDIYFDVTMEELELYVDEFHHQEYDVLYLGFCYCKGGETLKPASGMERLIHLHPNQSISCKHAILYRRSYLAKILPDILPLTCPSDSHMNHLNILQRAKVGIPDRGLVFQDRATFGSLNESSEPELPLFN